MFILQASAFHGFHNIFDELTFLIFIHDNASFSRKSFFKDFPTF